MATEPESKNEITLKGIIFAGVLLSLFTLFAIVTIIGYWPDKLPGNGKMARYENKFLKIRLLDSACISFPCKASDSAVNKKTNQAKNTIPPAKIDSSRKPVDTPTHNCNLTLTKVEDTIQLNTILMILVAAAGFLGNMVHIATSFTTFVGSNQFKRSWKLWYFVKPFTASALALIVYFAFRAGFLNSNEAANNINLYGIMAIATFSGLFTDIATQKLKEVFEVMFKPKENRVDPLTPAVTKAVFTDAKPATLSTNSLNEIMITGENFDNKKWTIKMNETEINSASVNVAAKLIHFSYTLSDADKALKAVVLTISSGPGNIDYTKKWDNLS